MPALASFLHVALLAAFAVATSVASFNSGAQVAELDEEEEYWHRELKRSYQSPFSTPVYENSALPRKFLDGHHHFFDTNGNNFSSFVEGLFGEPLKYLPEDYEADVRHPIERAGVERNGSVHVEFLPDDGPAEVAWVQSLIDAGRSDVKAIVGTCDLTAHDAERCLEDLLAASPLVRGVRWIINYANSIRVNETDLLNDGPGDGPVPSFEHGYNMLSKYNMSFDLHCDVDQLPGAYLLASRHPGVPLCINHIGRPRLVLPLGEEQPDEGAISEWRANMKAMSEMPHVYVKISQLGVSVPDWITSKSREAVVRDLVLETVAMFGPERCMVTLNWWIDAVTSDSDGIGTVGPTPLQLLERTSEWFKDFSSEARDRLFWKTAEYFYRISQ